MLRNLIALMLAMTMLLSAALPCAAEEEREYGLIRGSFIQDTLCRYWSKDEWMKEYAMMQEVGMDFIIIQCVYDVLNNVSLYLPTTEGLEGVKGRNSLENMLAAAKESGMQVYIGLAADNTWWDFSQADLALSSDGTSRFSLWCEQNGKLQADMIRDIWNQYGARYDEQIAGWYYHNEIWNAYALLPEEAVDAFTQLLADNMNTVIDAINEVSPHKPIMQSPFFNVDYGTAEGYGQWYADYFSRIHFRKGDIFSPQDAVGNFGGETIPVRIGQWIKALADATATCEELVFWVNNETFNAGLMPAKVERVIEQIEASDPYTDTHILFSYNHYYNPLRKKTYQKYHDQLVEYVNMRNAEGAAN